jgi:hypothetical protein
LRIGAKVDSLNATLALTADEAVDFFDALETVLKADKGDENDSIEREIQIV